MDYKFVRGVFPRSLLLLLDRVGASPLGARLASGMFWSVAGAVVSRGIALVVAIITARLLAPKIFGELGMVQSTMLMFGCFATLAMGLTATKFVAELRVKDPQRAGRIIGMSSAIAWISGSAAALLVVALAPWLSARTLAAPELTLAVQLGALCLVLTVVSETQLGALNGFEAFKRKSIIQGVVALILLPTTVAGVYWAGLKGALAAQALSLGVLVFLNARAIDQEARAIGVGTSWKGALQEIKVLWKFSIPTMLGGALYIPVVWIGNAIIVNTANGYFEMGIFSAAERWRTAIMFLPAQLGGVALPMLSSLATREGSSNYNRVLWLNLKAGLVAAGVLAIPIGILSPWIMAAYGQHFARGEWVLVVVCISSVVGSADWIIGQAMFSKGYVWLKFYANLLWAIVFLTIVWSFRTQGAIGLAAGYAAADSMRLLSMLLCLKVLRR